MHKVANRPAPFTEADVKRAVKGALAAGLTVREVITSAESIRVIVGDADDERGEDKTIDELIDEAP